MPYVKYRKIPGQTKNRMAKYIIQLHNRSTDSGYQVKLQICPMWLDMGRLLQVVRYNDHTSWAYAIDIVSVNYIPVPAKYTVPASMLIDIRTIPAIRIRDDVVLDDFRIEWV